MLENELIIWPTDLLEKKLDRYAEMCKEEHGNNALYNDLPSPTQKDRQHLSDPEIISITDAQLPPLGDHLRHRSRPAGARRRASQLRRKERNRRLSHALC